MDDSSIDRRAFLELMGASLALAGLTACSRMPFEKIVPYVSAPERIIPGRPLFFATAMTLSGYANGILVESHTGRPTKIEGNPDHPASLGSIDAMTQASILSLYDPERSKTVTHQGQLASWDDFISMVGSHSEKWNASAGTGLRILTETVSSPTLGNQLTLFLKRFPSAKWHQYEPMNRDHLREGAHQAFGKDVEPLYHFKNAEVIVSFDSDFLMMDPGSLRYAHDFADQRRVLNTKTTMNRLYVIESTPSITGANADHRLPSRAALIEEYALALAQALGLVQRSEPTSLPATHQRWLSTLAQDLKRHRGSSLVLAGRGQTPRLHSLVHAINHSLNNVGKTVTYTSPIEVRPENQMNSLRELVQDMRRGKVDTLIVMGGNPVYTAPADLGFSQYYSKLPLTIRLGLHEDETSALSHWHIPETHYLESWSDARAFDGTVTIMQPLIAPLYFGRSAHELIATFMGNSDLTSHQLVRQYWKNRKYPDTPTPGFEPFWEKSLQDGIVAGTSEPALAVALDPLLLKNISLPKRGPQSANELEIIFQPDPTIWDGRFSNNGWLQELLKPLTKLCWDNAALMSSVLASKMELKNEDVVDLRYQGRVVSAPVWIMPGHPNESVTVYLGYGRTHAGKVGNGKGFNAYQLLTSNAPCFGSGLQVQKTGRVYPLASTRSHPSMEGRDIVRVAPIQAFIKDPKVFPEKEAHLPTLYPPYESRGYAWGMAIDLNTCIGCSACVVACQAENNIPVVGKDQMRLNRDMLWIRVDRYFTGNPENPDTQFQPVPCMHCEHAPCEVVCPTEATVHDDEGLNEMIYNRCVGTRYCSNNCPYKVRRFNFFQYADWKTESLKPMRNPDVSVRSRGVMEKCTYCIQRIESARIAAEKENRKIRDGEVKTSCQQSCPAEAIVFGDINDPKSKVSLLKAQPQDYGLLAELGTRPRTTYLARFRNLNPEMGGG